MRLLNCFLIPLCLFLSSVTAFPVTIKRDDGKPIPATDDPFYTPPEGYEDKPLGSILKHRTVQSPGFLFLKSNLKRTVQIMYRSSNSSESPMAAVTTVLIPKNPDTSKLLSYQIYEDSSYLNCAPSYSIQYESNPEGIVAQVDYLLMQSALNEGWIVNTPDYEGPNSAFTAGILAGHATLDSIRAVLNSQNVTGVEKDSTVAMWGYSGGSLASGWAAELQPKYAPELKSNLAGAALGGFVPNITDVALAVNHGPFVGLVPAAFYGLSQEYPELDEYIQSQLIKKRADDYKKVSQQCIVQDALQFAFQNWGDLCKDGTDVLYHPVAQKVTSENNMGKNSPEIPLFIYHSRNDEVSPIKNAENTYDSYCSNGSPDIEFVKDATSEHIFETIAGSASAFNWLKERMTGKPLSEKGCHTRSTFSPAFDKGAVGAFGEEIAGALGSLLGRPIGPREAA